MLLPAIAGIAGGAGQWPGMTRAGGSAIVWPVKLAAFSFDPLARKKSQIFGARRLAEAVMLPGQPAPCNPNLMTAWFGSISKRAIFTCYQARSNVSARMLAGLWLICTLSGSGTWNLQPAFCCTSR